MSIRVVLCDIDGVITRGEGQPVDLSVISRLAAFNQAALADPRLPALALCTGRQAPYVELMAQLTDTFLPCIFEHGAGLFFPRAFLFDFDPSLGSDYSARLCALRCALEPVLLAPARAFVQPGKEATMTLYPLSGTSVDVIVELASEPARALGFDTARNVRGVELRPHGIDKSVGLRRLAAVLDLSLDHFAGVGDSDPDLGFLRLCGFSAAPANATPAVRSAVGYVSRFAFGEGLLDILQRLPTAHTTLP